MEADIVLGLNTNKNGKENHVGASVFAEITFAVGIKMASNKNIEIYLLNPIPKDLPYTEELELWKKLGWIKIWNK